MSDRPLRIAINAQLLPGKGSGGAESVLVALIRMLGNLTDGDEEYLIIGPWQDPTWLQPYTGANQRLYSWKSDDARPGFWRARSDSLKGRLGSLRPHASRLFRTFVKPPRQQPETITVSDGFYEALGCDVIHFPFQRFAICSVPFIFNPHDLQHLHYPQFFSPAGIAEREIIYPFGCRLAQTIVVASQFVKDDIVYHYSVPAKKIQVIPWAAPTEAFTPPTNDAISAVRIKYSLPTTYALYPAMIWEHKNHIRLVEAIASLRDREGLSVNLVLTGSEYAFWKKVQQRIAELNLQTQVLFLGCVTRDELRCVYRAAQFVVIPTLFEAVSSPLFEAWREDIPVTCSNVTSLPEQAADAALLFDPFSTESIADAVKRLATDSTTRNELRLKGGRRLLDFSWVRTAKAYRAVYRRAARRQLTDEDSFLLNWDWMRNTDTKDNQ